MHHLIVQIRQLAFLLETMAIHLAIKHGCKDVISLTGDTEHNRTPVVLAVRTGAPSAVIERLTQLESFATKGLDDLGNLARLVENSEAVQDGAVRILAQRRYFGIIMVDVYA